VWVTTGGGAVVTTTGGGGGGDGDGGGGGGSGALLGTGATLGTGAGDGGGGTGVGITELAGGNGTGAMVGTTGASRFSTPANVYATPPIAVMATRAHRPMTNCESRTRRHGRSPGGSIMFRRIDQLAGPSSS
jgi:hypothetical protein